MDTHRIGFKSLSQKPEKPEHTLSLTMDIHGEIGYDPESVNVRVKGDLIPWALVDSESDKEKDLFDIDDEQLNYYTNLFNNNLETATDVVIGLYPIDEDKYDNLESADKFTECEGEYEFVDKKMMAINLLVSNLMSKLIYK